MLIFVKRRLPLLCLHVTKPQPTTRCCIFWELCQCSLVLSCSFPPLAIPAKAIGCIHCCAEDLSVPRHERFTSYINVRYALSISNLYYYLCHSHTHFFLLH